MNELDRVALVSVLHPVRHAAEAINEQIWIAKGDALAPDLAEAERALDALAAEVARARTLVQRLSGHPDA
ncbi:hypothetical protein ACIBHY_17210 [Nonomuraea sp. NPDC050547]|uniref:hypothetical protein n=1 Tax=Nonomuraea sp. NPDC050547 TaxID=3364368 RepID=UPI00379203F4